MSDSIQPTLQTKQLHRDQTMAPLSQNDIEESKKLRSAFDGIKTELSKVIVGQNQVIEELLIALFSKGHCMLEGVPGLAKTLMISTLARTRQERSLCGPACAVLATGSHNRHEDQHGKHGLQHEQRPHVGRFFADWPHGVCA